MKNLMIIGARGFGREVYQLADECIRAGLQIKVSGFLDDKNDTLDNYNNYPPIVSSVENYLPQDDDVFICALGNPIDRKKYSQIILDKGGIFISLIHPSVRIGINSILGNGCIVNNNVILSCDVKIGDFVVLMPSSVIGHDVSIDDYSHVGSFAFMGGFSKAGKCSVLHPGSKILPHKLVGENSIVGAGSVVIRNVKFGITVLGIPAKKI